MDRQGRPKGFGTRPSGVKIKTMQIQDTFNIKGLVKTTIYDTTDPKAAKLEAEIQKHIASKPVFSLPFGITDNDRLLFIEAYKQKLAQHREVYKSMVRELSRLFKVREYAVENIIVTVGRAVLAQRLANDTTYTGIINYGALGSDNTTPVNGNTTLGTEVFRKVTASTSDTDNIAFIDFFYSKADTNGTYEEFGTFIDGTASADTGQMFTHALTGSWVKTASESMTVAVQYTIT